METAYGSQEKINHQALEKSTSRVATRLISLGEALLMSTILHLSGQVQLCLENCERNMSGEIRQPKTRLNPVKLNLGS